MDFQNKYYGRERTYIMPVRAKVLGTISIILCITAFMIGYNFNYFPRMRDKMDARATEEWVSSCVPSEEKERLDISDKVSVKYSNVKSTSINLCVQLLSKQESKELSREDAANYVGMDTSSLPDGTPFLVRAITAEYPNGLRLYYSSRSNHIIGWNITTSGNKTPKYYRYPIVVYIEHNGKGVDHEINSMSFYYEIVK